MEIKKGKINSYRLKQLVENGTVKKVISLPEWNPLYLIGETYWCGYWQKYYTVENVNYSAHLLQGKPYMRLKDVTVVWEDGKKGTHCTDLDAKRDYRIKL